MKRIGIVCLLLLPLLAPGISQSTTQQNPQSTTGPVDLTTLERYLAEHRYQALIQLVEGSTAQQNFPSQAYYYLAQAYRLRRYKGDDLLAARAYHRAIRAAPNFALAYRDLGILQMKANRKKKSLKNLTTYLKLKPSAEDRFQIEQYIRLISRK
jgi:tetratricopeptide (TPR) repeat protein